MPSKYACLVPELYLVLLVAASFSYSGATNWTSVQGAAAVQCTRQIDACRCETANGGRIDLSPLANTGGQFAFDSKRGPSGAYFYSYNPCVAATCDGNRDAAACQRRADGGGQYILGTQSSATFSTHPTLGLMLTYGAVSGDRNAREAQLQLVCDTSGSGESLFTALTDGGGSMPIVYKFSLLSGHCCEISPGPSGVGDGGLSGGDILLIVFFSLVFAYLAIGSVVNLAIRKQTGIEALPNLAFWVVLPGLVREGAVFTFAKVKQTVTRRGGDYQNI